LRESVGFLVSIKNLLENPSKLLGSQRKEFDLVVIGAGGGGYVASIRAAQLGRKVAGIEKESTGGGTGLNIGRIPSKAVLKFSEKLMEKSNHIEEHGMKTTKVDLDLAKLREGKEKIVKKLTRGIGWQSKKNKIMHIPGKAT
jgi:Pyruvate/2-oxoglutarate dehydrogenase complex, dihydrolipoamide dehydrogenase (E3) component, and related enzymes